MPYVSKTEQTHLTSKYGNSAFSMLSVRQLLQAPAVRLARTSATLQAAPAAAAAAEGASATTRPRPFTPRRPNISRERPREWNRPLAFGVLPAYDEALKYIKTDSEVLKTETRQLQAALEKAKAAPEPDTDVIQKMEEKLAILEIQSQVNLPEVRWKIRNGMGMFVSPGRVFCV